MSYQNAGSDLTGSFIYDDFVLSDNVVTANVKLKSGESVVRGQGMVRDGNSFDFEFVASVGDATVIAVQDVDATSGQTDCEVYVTGKFNIDKFVLKPLETDTVAANVPSLFASKIFLEKAQYSGA